MTSQDTIFPYSPKRSAPGRSVLLLLLSAAAAGLLAVGAPGMMTARASSPADSSEAGELGVEVAEGHPFAQVAGTDGTMGNPYQIETIGQLNGIRDNSESGGENYLEDHFILKADLDFSSHSYADPQKGWLPIGHGNFSSSGSFEGSKFTGSFDGRGYVIHNLKINRPDEDFVGLFRSVRGSIVSLGIEGVDVVGRSRTGGLTGVLWQGSSVSNCYTTGHVHGINEFAGGMVGEMWRDSRLENSYSSAQITGGSYVGGLTGRLGGAYIINCYATGDVAGRAKVGGLVGYAVIGAYANCYATGHVTGVEDVGGLAGRNFRPRWSVASFWNTELSEQETSDVGTGLSTAEMYEKASFPMWPFDNADDVEDATDIWTAPSASDQHFPHLKGMKNGQVLKLSAFDGPFLPTAPAFELEPTFLPTTLDSAPVYTSSDETVARVDVGTGEVTIVGVGTTVLTIRRAGNEDYSCVVASKELEVHTPIVLSNHFIQAPAAVDTVVGTFSVMPGPGDVSYTYTYGFAEGGDGGGKFKVDSATGVLAVNAALDAAEEVVLTVTATSTPAGNDLSQRISVRVLAAHPFARVEGTDGTMGNPYQIETIGQLNGIRDNSGSGGENYLDDHFILKADLDFSSHSYADPQKGWLPIGHDTDSINRRFEGSTFTGSFDGKGYVIHNLKINRPDEDFVGLFGSVRGSIVSLGVEGVDVVGRSRAGGLAGRLLSRSSVSNCYTTGRVHGVNEFAGGMSGEMLRDSRLENSYSSAQVTGDSGVGGLTGSLGGAYIINCYATGDVAGRVKVGGLVGTAVIGGYVNCYATGHVTGVEFVGGMVGRNLRPRGSVTSFWNTELSGQETSGFGTGLRTAEMYEKASFPMWPFDNADDVEDATDIWTAPSASDQHFPHLKGMKNGQVLKLSAFDGPFLPTAPAFQLEPIFLPTTLDSAPVYTSSDETVARVDAGTGEVTVVGVGTTVLTIRRAGNDDYSSVVGSKKLEVHTPIVLSNHFILAPVAVDAVVGTLSVTPGPGDVSYTYTYGFAEGENGGGKFKVDSATGVLAVNAALDTAEEVVITVTATSTPAGNDLSQRISVSVLAHPFAHVQGTDGSEENPYHIETAGQLNGIRDNRGAGGTNYLDDHFILKANLDFADYVYPDPAKGWLPIGHDTDTFNRITFRGTAFTGSFNGDGYVIHNLKINRPEQDWIGVFGQVDGSVDSLGVDGVHAVGRKQVGGLAGELHGGSISNSYTTGYVRALSGPVGGLLGFAWPSVTLRRSYSSAQVTGNGQVGGLVGVSIGGNIMNCYAAGDITGSSYVGGLVGRALGAALVANCYATGHVAGDTNVGGLLGINSGIVYRNNFWNTDLSGQRSSPVGKGLRTAEMYEKASFPMWDFDNEDGRDDATDIWVAPSASGEHFPHLKGMRNAQVFALSPLDGPVRTTASPFPLKRSFLPTRYGAGLAHESSDETVATMRTYSKEVTVVGPGSTTLTFRRVRFDIYSSVSVSRELEVRPPIVLDSHSILAPAAVDAVVGTLSVTPSLGNVSYTYTYGFAVGGNGGGKLKVDPATGVVAVNTPIDTVGEIEITVTATSTPPGDNLSQAITVRVVGHPFAKVENTNGSVGKPYQIETIAHLDGIRDNSGSGGENYLDDHFILVADLDFAGHVYADPQKGWLPIGHDTIPGNGATDGRWFTGSFDGGGYVVRNLKINRPDENYIGLFGYVVGSIKSLGIEGVHVLGERIIGGLAGKLRGGSISNCYTTGRVHALDGAAGGLLGAGEAYTTVLGSYSSAQVTGDSDVGGLVGSLTISEVMNCYTTGDVAGSSYVGGLVGNAVGALTNCYATGLVTGSTNVGGLVGRGAGGSNSFWNTDLSGQGSSPVGTGLGTAEMYEKSSFTMWPFDNGDDIDDETDIWTEPSASDQHFPHLKGMKNGQVLVLADFDGPVRTTAPSFRLEPIFLPATYGWEPVNASSDETVASVVNIVTGVVNVYEAGTTVITISRTGDENYSSVTVSKELEVRAPIVLDPSSIQTPAWVDAVVGTVSVIPASGDASYTYTYGFAEGGNGNGKFKVDSATGVLAVNTALTVEEEVEITVTAISTPTGDDLSQVITVTVVDGEVEVAEYHPFIQSAYADGSEKRPYHIETIDHLNSIRDNRGDGGENYLASHYVLITDLDFAGFGYADTQKGWLPLGHDVDPSSKGFDGTAFTGSFDGKGNVIHNLKINRPDENYVGLFGGLRGSVVSLGMEGVHVVGGSVVGGLAGRLTRAVFNCYTTGYVHAVSGSAGGLLGIAWRDSRVRKSYSSAQVTGVKEVGGLVGISTLANVVNSYATGDVTGDVRVGGLVGYNPRGLLINCYATGRVTGSTNVGGLVGSGLAPRGSNSFWNTDLSGQDLSGFGTGLGTTEMYLEDSFTMWGFDNGDDVIDETDIWTEPSASGQHFPHLKGMKNGQVLVLVDFDDVRTEASPFTLEPTFLPATLGSAPVYTSSDKTVATVDTNTGEVTVVGVGATILTISRAGDDDYSSVTVSKELEVSADVSWNFFALIAPVRKDAIAGTVSVTPAPGDAKYTYTYGLAEGGDGGGKFKIDPATGIVSVAKAIYVVEDVEITVTATSTPSGDDLSKVITVRVVDGAVVPATPSNLVAISEAEGTISLSWEAPVANDGPDVSGYKIEMSTDGLTWTTVVGDTESTTTTYTHAGRTPDATIHYRVSAISSVGTSDTSNVDSATVRSQTSVVEEIFNTSAPYATAIKVYPNPAVDILYLDLAQGRDYALALLSLTGKLVIEEDHEGGGNFHLALPAIPGGIYILKVEDSEGGVLSFRVVLLGV